MNESQILLSFPHNCVKAKLLQRVKRFSVECAMGSTNAVDEKYATCAEPVWAHTNNSGSMLGLVKKGFEAFLSPAPNPKRKLPYTLEMIGIPDWQGNTMWVGVNTLVPNKILRLAFEAGLLPWAEGYTDFVPEAKRGASRLDALLTGKGLPPLWVECKNVTLVEGEVASFPDAPTLRGQKHLREMIDIVESGERAAFFYLVQRNDAKCFAPASYVDPSYAKLFYESLEAGVEAYPYQARLCPSGVGLDGLLPLAPDTCYSDK